MRTWVRASPRVNGIDAVRKRSDIARINTKMFLQGLHEMYVEMVCFEPGYIPITESNIYRKLYIRRARYTES